MMMRALKKEEMMEVASKISANQFLAHANAIQVAIHAVTTIGQLWRMIASVAKMEIQLHKFMAMAQAPATVNS